ncbi:hypothetical protein BGZ54_000891, partial [Gamsiella multidivaricata]
DGDVWVLGRNEKGQLGVGDTNPHPLPMKIPTIYSSAGNKKSTNLKFVDAAVGRNHSIIIASNGAVYGAGDNKMGQLGNDNLKEHPSFVHISSLGREKGASVACGAEFTMVLSEKGQLWAFGSPEYGQLGNKTNGQYLQQSNRLVHMPQTSPVLVAALKDKVVTKVRCGTNHTLALTDGVVYSWGFGGYGRLGHSKQEDLWSPMPIEQFAGSNKISRATDIAAGSSFSMALDGQGQFWLWGKWKTTGDGGGGTPWMYPRTMYDLNGWSFRAFSGGNVTLFCIPTSEPCTIAWGQGAIHSELGYGEGEPRSSTKPDKVRPLEGLIMKDVSCGLGHTLLLCKPGQEKLQDLPKWPLLDVEEHCIECLSAEDEESMLLCDKCDSGTHLHCTVPRLQAVPDTDWFCQGCTRAKEKNRTKSSSDGSDLSSQSAGKTNAKRKAPAGKAVGHYYDLQWQQKSATSIRVGAR